MFCLSDLEFVQDSDDMEEEDEIDADEDRLEQLRAEEEEDMEDFGDSLLEDDNKRVKRKIAPSDDTEMETLKSRSAGNVKRPVKKQFQGRKGKS